MRDYQRQHDNPYLLPEYLYKMVKYAIKDYDRILAQKQDILYSVSLPPNGMPRSGKVPNPTEDKGLKLAALSHQLECIDQALHMVPQEYRKGVFNEARYGGGFSTDAGERTYKRWKQKFVYWTAQNMGMV